MLTNLARSISRVEQKVSINYKISTWFLDDFDYNQTWYLKRTGLGLKSVGYSPKIFVYNKIQLFSKRHLSFKYIV